LNLDSGMRFGRFANGEEKKTNPKTLFRQSKAWKDFRNAMILMNDGKCELCGIKYTPSKFHLLQVHHLDPDNYEILDPAKFSVLCSSDHDLIERFVTRINGRQFQPPENIEQWDALVRNHLSWPARKKWDDAVSGKYQAPTKAKGKKNEV